MLKPEYRKSAYLRNRKHKENLQKMSYTNETNNSDKKNSNNSFNDSEKNEQPPVIHVTTNNNLVIPLEYLQIIFKISSSPHINQTITIDDLIIIANVMKDTQLNEKLSFINNLYLDYLPNYITIDNVCNVYQLFHKFNENSITKKCEKIISHNADIILFSSEFHMMDIDVIKNILTFNYFNINEIEIFEALIKWAEINCQKKGLDLTMENKRNLLDDASKLIRFGTLNNNQLKRLFQIEPNFFTDSEMSNITLTKFSQTINENGNAKINRYVPFISEFPFEINKFSYSTTNTCLLPECNKFQFQSKNITVFGVKIYSSEEHLYGHIEIRFENNNELIDETFYTTSCSEIKTIYFKKEIKIQAHTCFVITNKFLNVINRSNNDNNGKKNSKLMYKKSCSRQTNSVHVSYSQSSLIKCLLFKTNK